MTIVRTIASVLLLPFVLLAQTPTADECAADNENLACCFLNAPKELSHVITIADNREPGERMVVKGKVTLADRKTPAPQVIIYAYHTDEKGIYPKKGNETGIHKWHGYLHSWGKTNQRGEFEIRSIRPAQYPSRDFPAHVHLVIKEPSGRIYYVADITFDDDPLVRNKKEEGVITVKKNHAGMWEGFRTIVLRR